jgi:hypothetical protein
MEPSVRAAVARVQAWHQQQFARRSRMLAAALAPRDGDAALRDTSRTAARMQAQAHEQGLHEGRQPSQRRLG